jgi:repressor LexA
MLQLYKNIKEKRIALGMSQDELAQKTGYTSRSSIAKIEAGKVDLPQTKIKLFAEALNTTQAELTGWECINILEGLHAIAIKPNEYIDQQTADFLNSLTFEEMEALLKQTNIVSLPATKKVPLVGKIACGTPITAEENIEDYVDVPEDVYADFALICQGDSMINARIHDGDIVYIRMQPEVENGEIAAVFIDGEATLKRVYYQKGRIILQPENNSYPPMIYEKTK